MMVHFVGYFPQFAVHLVVYIDIFLELQLKDKIQIELKSHFHIKIETNNVLHLTFEHIFTYQNSIQISYIFHESSGDSTIYI